MLKLYQIYMTRSEIDQVNLGNTSLPIYKARCDALMLGRFPGSQFYTHVADIATDDLDNAFEIGNIGPEAKLTRYAPMHSVSVGDVLVTEAGVAFIVKPVGFEAVNGWEGS